MMADRRVSLYVGYYEVLLTRQDLGEPYVFAGFFDDVAGAAAYAETYCPSADIIPMNDMEEEYADWMGVSD